MDLPTRKEYEETQARNDSEALTLETERLVKEIETAMKRVSSNIKKGRGVSGCYLTNQEQQDTVIARFKEAGWKITPWLVNTVKMEPLEK